MAGRDPNVKVKVTAQNDTKKGLKQAEAEVKTFASNVSTMIKGAFAFAAAGALGGLFKAAISEASEAQKSFNFIGQALANIGVNAQKVRPEIESTISALSQKMGIDDDEIKMAFAGLITRVGDYKTSLKALPTVIDVAKARNLELGKASDLVAKALAGNEGALKKLGVTVKETETPFDALRRTFNGFADADAQTFEGSLNRIKVAWKNVLQTLGGAILGTNDISEATGWFIDKLTSLEQYITENQKAIEDITGAMITFGKNVITVAGFIGTTLVSAFQGAQLVIIQMVAGFEMIPQGVKLAFGTVLETIADWAEKANGLLGKFGINFGDGVIGSVKNFSSKMIKEASAQIKILELAKQSAWEDVFKSDPVISSAMARVKPLGPDDSMGKQSDSKDKTKKENDTELDRLKKMVAALETAIEQGRFLDAETQKALEATMIDLEEEIALNSNSFERQQSLLDLQNKLGTSIGGLLQHGTFTPETVPDDKKKGSPHFVSGLSNAGINLVKDGESEYANMLDTTNSLKEALGELAGNSLVVAGDAFANFFTTIGQQVGRGKIQFGEFGKAVRQALAQAAMAEAKDSVARGIKALAQGLLTDDPKALAASAQYFASAAAFGALGGLIGGNSISRSSFGPSGGNTGTETFNATRGDATIVIQGGILDMTDPKQAKYLADAINQLSGRRVTIVPR